MEIEDGQQDDEVLDGWLHSIISVSRTVKNVSKKSMACRL